MTPNETIILIAEDEPVVRNLVQLMLAREGYILLTASDGQEALEICEAFTAPIDLLLTDVRMPRLDGLTLAETVRKRRPDMKILVMSGETTSVIREKNVYDAFLRKPFVPPTLLQCVQKVLEASFQGVCEDI
jgi:two-component system cell cycle sensor histidine kinase/response regulator CckA